MTPSPSLGTAVPVAGTVAGLVWRRRLDPVGILAALGFGVAVLVMVLSHGNALVLKLQDTVVTGPLGAVCLVSVAVRRPLHLVVLQFLAPRNPRARAALRDPARRRASAVVTALVGAMLLVHAVVLLGLALTQPTGTFLAVSRPVGWSVVGDGVAALLWYRRRRRTGSGAGDTTAATGGTRSAGTR